MHIKVTTVLICSPSMVGQTQGGRDTEALEEFRRAVNAAAGAAPSSPDKSKKRKASAERDQRENRAFSIFL